MVDFKKKLGGKVVEKQTNPVKLYDTLDREADKGPLRPAQIAVLKKWFEIDTDERDTIVKLHTGQGKTLIGLLMLQSRLNAGYGPVVYICPNNFLVDQTCEQARQFGIRTCTSEGDLPEDFIDGRSILVTSVQKVFNGLTKFGLNKQSLPVDTMLMDDAHVRAGKRLAAVVVIERHGSVSPSPPLRHCAFASLLACKISDLAHIASSRRSISLPQHCR